MTVIEKLKEYDLYDQSITRHGILVYVRDYEVIGYISGQDFDIEVQYIFKGCINVNYHVKVLPDQYSLDNRLLDLDLQDEPDYPKGFIWGANHAVVFPGWILEEGTDELKKLEGMYNLKFYQVHFDTNAYDLTITFHDIEINELKHINKKKNAL